MVPSVKERRKEKKDVSKVWMEQEEGKRQKKQKKRQDNKTKRKKQRRSVLKIIFRSVPYSNESLNQPTVL